MKGKKPTGRAGEAEAAEYLRGRGFDVIAQNWQCRYGELDIIAVAGRYVVFAEVKTRANASLAQAREFVTPAKQRRLKNAALMWLQHSGSSLQPRFDVIEIYTDPEPHTLNHIENAF